MRSIVIISEAGDLHAWTARELIEQWRPEVPVHILESNRSLRIHHSLEGARSSFSFVAADGARVNLADAAVIWARRVGAGSFVAEGIEEPAQREFAAVATRSTLASALRAASRATVLNPLSASVAAEDKILQLRVASAMGFRVPRTILSSDPVQVRTFVRDNASGVIVKPLRGTRAAKVFVDLVDPDSITDGDIGCCPVLYQEHVPGPRHLRVNVFGEEVLAFQIRSPHIDWRVDYGIPMEHVLLEPILLERCQRYIRALGLEMGVLDLKCAPDGDFVFLEVNPQGQYLFLEAVTGYDLRSVAAQFLLDTYDRHATTARVAE